MSLNALLRVFELPFNSVYLCMYVCIGHRWKGTALSHRKEKQKTKEIGGHALAAHVATQGPDN